MAAKSDQAAFFLDSTGRVYSLPAHTLPSARGQGEPLTGRLNPPAGANFIALLMGDDTDKWVMASDAGYGFIVTLADLAGKNRAGKAMLTVPDNAKALVPKRMLTEKNAYLAVASNTGYLLIFRLDELPQLAKGKGNKLMHLKKEEHEFVADFVILTANDNLIIKSDGKPLTLKPSDWKHFLAERAKRGFKLPRGCRNVKGFS